MNNTIILDKKATELVKEVVGGSGGGGNGSDYVATTEQFNNAFNGVSFDGTKVLELLKTYGVDVSMGMYKADVGEFFFMLAIDPRSSVNNVLNNKNDVIIGYDYYGYNFYNNFSSATQVPIYQNATFEDLLLILGYQLLTTVYTFNTNTIVFSCGYAGQIEFKTVIKIQDLIDCIAN